MAKIYWRRIKAGTRFFVDVPTEELKAEIRALALAEVAAGKLTMDQYEDLLDEDYPVEEDIESQV